MSDEKKFALEIAKEITIAQLNHATPTSPYKELGESIGEMFEEIYNKVSSLTSN